MGTYYTARAIIGYKISTENSYTEKVVPNCEHKFGAESGVKFCPTCGAKAGTHKEHHSREDWQEFYDFCNEQGSALGMTHEDDQEYSKFCWFGYGVSCDNEMEAEMIPLRPYDEIKAEIIAMLEPFTTSGVIKLEDEHFGLHCTFIGH